MAISEVVVAILARGAFSELARALDAAEVEAPQPNVLEGEWPHAIHLLGHIHDGNLCDARFLWKRIPDGVKQNSPELEAAWKLLQFCWNKQYAGIWQALNGFQWSAQVRPLVEALSTQQRQQMLDLVARAYGTITPAGVGALCGMSEAEALSVCTAQLGWGYDAAQRVLSVVYKQPSAGETEGLQQLETLAGYMVHIES